MTPQKQIITALLKKFPDAATMTLAKRAYKDAPEAFASLESARSQVRTLRGAAGEKRRKYSPPELQREPGKAGAGGFQRIPEGWVDLPDWKAECFCGARKTLVLSDIHFPYHHKGALVAALEYGRDRGADTILLNGDIADCYAISRWEKDPRKRHFADEVRLVNNFLKTLREEFPKAEIIFKLGNHDERFENYMMLKAPELLDVPQFSFQRIMGLEDQDIQLVRDMRPIRLGKLNVIHGHEFKVMSSDPVNPARGFFMRAKVHVLGGHYHRSSQHSETDLEGKVISTWSTGCLCELHPQYRPINSWNWGFAFVDTDSKGAFNVSNLKVIDGKVY